MTQTIERRTRPSVGERHTVRFGNVQLEIRGRSGDTIDIEGYASTYDTEYEVAGGPPWGWTESIEQEAGAESLGDNPDVVLLVNHDGLPLARTKSKTLELAEDSTGLHHRAPGLSLRDPDVAQIVPKIERGDVDEMSFAFRVERHEWDESYERRWITKYNINRGDVSYVTFGANPDTTVDLRALEAIQHLAEVDPRQALAELRSAHRGDTTGLVRRAMEVLGTISESGEKPEASGTLVAGGTPDAIRGGMPLDLARELAEL